MQKQYIVWKIVMARSAAEAIRLEKKVKPDEVFVDDDWKKNEPNGGEIGFQPKPRKKIKPPS